MAVDNTVAVDGSTGTVATAAAFVVFASAAVLDDQLCARYCYGHEYCVGVIVALVAPVFVPPLSRVSSAATGQPREATL